MKDEPLIHFRWSEDAIKQGKAPRCDDRANAVHSILPVTCPRCSARIMEILDRWEEDYGPGRKAGPR